MKWLTAAAQVKQLRTIIGIWAHPDDETFLAGGLFQLAKANGQKVVCVTATKGELGFKHSTKSVAERSAIRANELSDSLKILGIDEHHYLGYSDGDCAKIGDAEAVQKLLNIFNKYRPDTIITFGSEGLTGHPDHRAVHRWAKLSSQAYDSPTNLYQAVVESNNYKRYLKTADKELSIFFMITKPPVFNKSECDICLELPSDIVKRKCKALEAMSSQTAKMFERFDKSFIEEAWSTEAFRLSR